VRDEKEHRIACRHCHRRVDNTATWCPRCGKSLNRFGGANLIMVIGAVIAMLAALSAILWGLVRD
jgi:RNA polymerase subunit RPABC4/transcription elongation factor Spt4